MSSVSNLQSSSSSWCYHCACKGECRPGEQECLICGYESADDRCKVAKQDVHMKETTSIGNAVNDTVEVNLARAFLPKTAVYREIFYKLTSSRHSSVGRALD